MDTTGYANWKPATLVKGDYEVKIVFAENFLGKNADENGEVSTGMRFQYEVQGPQDKLLTNGQSVVGFKFSELLLEPKRNSSLKYIDKCNAKWNAQLNANFGDNIPQVVQPEDFFDRVFIASAYPKWSDYDQAEVPEISYRKPII